jgi:hypothetical protein
MAYSYARLGGRDLFFFRFCGPGLGNLLFPWARFVVATKRYNLVPIAPAWPQIKWGPIWRWEKDKRFYVGLFRTPEGQIGSLGKLLLSRLEGVPESALDDGKSIERLGKRHVVVFEGMQGYFSRILRDHKLVRTHLLDMTKEKHKAGMTYRFERSISVHVRLTDFLPATDKATLNPEASVRLPISWYQRMIEEIRRGAGSDLPVHIFSDGKDEELALLLRMPNVRRVTFGSSIADMLAMSCSHVLIASGSTFSRWASYLGRMPVVWYPGLLANPLYYDNLDAEVECGLDDSLPESFLSAVECYCCQDLLS